MSMPGPWELALIFLIVLTRCSDNSAREKKLSSIVIEKEEWIKCPQNEWPQITMVNHIRYLDSEHHNAGCGFLLDIGADTIAVTAKHLLHFFKSNKMNSVSFNHSLVIWEMHPKNNMSDNVILGEIINENPEESIEKIPVDKDWLLLRVKQKSNNIVPLRFRESALVEGEDVYIIGWRYSDNNCTQRIYEGNVVKSLGSSILITTKALSDNKIPGLSGSPVIDAGGYLIGIMSQKYGKMERLSSTLYPKKFLANKINKKKI